MRLHATPWTIATAIPAANSLCLAVLVSGMLARFLYLDADPNYYAWIGYITDEGRWVQHARSLALHGILIDANGLHFFLAPLFELINYAIFAMAGVSVFTSRLFTALCGSALLLLVWVSLRRSITPQALLVVLTLLAFQADLVALSRLAVPEMALMLLQLIIFLVIVSKRGFRWRVVAGVLMLALAAMKMTALLFLLIFSAMIFFMPQKPAASEERWRDLMGFWVGFVTPATVFGSVFLFIAPWDVGTLASHANGFWRTIEQFVVVSTIFNVIKFPFAHALAPTFNLWALGLWFSALAWAAARRGVMDSTEHRYIALLAIWIAVYLAVMSILGYFPMRYKVHILLPMALCIGVGISLGQRVGFGNIVDFVTTKKGPTMVLWLALLGLPTAAFFSPTLASIADMFAMDSERLLVKLACLSASVVATSTLLFRFKRKRRIISIALIFPLGAAMAWSLSSTLVEAHTFWPSAGSPFHSLWWPLILLAVSAISVTLVRDIDRWNADDYRRSVTTIAMFYLAISLVRIVPAQINPQYSIRDASRDLGILLSTSPSIVAVTAETLFNENKLPYQNFFALNWPDEKPDALVVAFRYDWVKDVVDQEYHLVKSYDILVSPEYGREGNSDGSLPSEGVLVSVYRKNNASP